MEQFHKNSTKPNLFSVKLPSKHIHIIVVIGVIFLFIVMPLVFYFVISKNFRKHRNKNVKRPWIYCIASSRPKLTISSSSAASTNSTNLQESQSFLSAQFVQNKTFRGDLLIHKLEFMDSISCNQHSTHLSGMLKILNSNLFVYLLNFVFSLYRLGAYFLIIYQTAVK